MKVAIYARYSSENQRDASIGDQFRICREFAQRQGWHIAAEYSDHAVSGATIMRPGFQALMREALQKKVDIVMAEARSLQPRPGGHSRSLQAPYIRRREHRHPR
jgi:site-specific DNA recombinase